MKKILVFDSHPVQYRVPLWRELTSKNIDLKVIYATDCSVKGYNDRQFGVKVSWDGDMLEGYKYTVLNTEKGEPLRGWSSLTGKGIKSLIKQENPDYIFLTGFNYKYDIVAYFNAIKFRVPLLLRCETQDFVKNRSKIKFLFRYIAYFLIYKGVSKIFYIGELNKEHYLRHGVSEKKLFPAKYTTLNRFKDLTILQKRVIREKKRNEYGIDNSKYVIGFSGKLIPKKNPDLLLEAVTYLPESIKQNVNFLFVGSGELEQNLKNKSKELKEAFNITSIYTGFVNQSEILENYLIMDLLVLPSRKQGETWGLVANEGLQAGCSVIVSDSVGSHKDFENLERFDVCKTEDARDLALKIENLFHFKYNPEWAKETVLEYSIETNATNIENVINK